MICLRSRLIFLLGVKKETFRFIQIFSLRSCEVVDVYSALHIIHLSPETDEVLKTVALA